MQLFVLVFNLCENLTHVFFFALKYPGECGRDNRCNKQATTEAIVNRNQALCQDHVMTASIGIFKDIYIIGSFHRYLKAGLRISFKMIHNFSVSLATLWRCDVVQRGHGLTVLTLCQESNNNSFQKA